MFDKELRSATDQALELQERLVRAAYGLHFSCASVAGLLEQRAVTAPLSSVDHQTEAKRWRVASDQALDVVRFWEGHLVGQ